MKIAIYPIEDPKKSTTNNPYIKYTIESFEKNKIEVINKKKYTKLGIISLFPYFFKADLFYLNWVEDLPERKLGIVQNLFLFSLLLLSKIFKKKVIWIMHNKISHSKKNKLLKIINFYLLTNYSDEIITHSKEGVTFGKSFLKKNRKINFIHHPMNKNNIKINQKTYDILIWGSITKYKGILEFLSNCSSEFLNNYKICIAGKINDKDLENDINKFSHQNLEIINTFITNDHLNELLSKTKIVLFTYSGFSTLSSGSLMYSLERDCHIIGPNHSAFKDLADINIIQTYNRFSEIDKLIKENKNFTTNSRKFINNNSWDNFGLFISNLIKDFNENT